MSNNNDTILKVENLTQIFEIPKSRDECDGWKEKWFGGHTELKAVNDVSFEIKRGETLGIVGESGSGKSTTGRTIIGLNHASSGSIEFLGKEIAKKLTKSEKMELAQKMQMIFQDPYASVNPRLTVEDIIGEGLILHHPEMSKEQRREKIIDLLQTVGLSETHISRYSHEFSGGQLQRIGIARALAVKPEFIIADEAISALDVSIQAQVVNLLLKLQKEYGLTYMFIAHDLSMVKYISDNIAVMYKGKILEMATAAEIYENPIHPYTKSLLSAIPHPNPIYEKNRQRITYDGSIHDYDESVESKKPQYFEITDTHKVYCSEEELTDWS